MACEKDTKTMSEKAQKENKIENNKKEDKMEQNGVLVLKQMPEFKAEAYNAETGHYVEVNSEDYKGKWTIVCFYPAVFTFVCPTEIAAMNASLDVIKVN
jgi:peroxiredoxin